MFSIPHFRVIIILLASGMILPGSSRGGCGGNANPEPEIPRDDVHATLTQMRSALTGGDTCEFGGVIWDHGVDGNDNGELDDETEITQTTVVCCGVGTQYDAADNSCVANLSGEVEIGAGGEIRPTAAHDESKVREGVDSVDITTDNQAQYEAGVIAGKAAITPSTGATLANDSCYPNLSIDVEVDGDGNIIPTSDYYTLSYEAGVASVDITSDNPSCDWTSQHWNGTFCESSMVDVNLSGTNLTGAVLKSSRLFGVDLSNADLSNVNLQFANLSGANLTNATLWRAFAVSLEGSCPAALPTSWDCIAMPSGRLVLVGPGANLWGVNLSGVDLSGVNLSEAALAYANLTGANLTGTNLHGAIIHHANLTNAIVTDAVLTDADLTESILEGANMADALLCIADSECADDDPCTTDSCVNGACVQAEITGCCIDDEQCNDGLSCTANTCFEHACTTASITTGCCIEGACNPVFGVPLTSFTVPENQNGQGFYYQDIQASFPDVAWDTIDRLYIPAGHYKYLSINNLPDRSPDHPLVITNEGGQVWVGALTFYHLFSLGGGSNWILTGRWDPVSETGHHDFPGHDGNVYANTAGTYGFMVDDQFIGNGPGHEAISGFSVGGGATDFEIEFVEITRVGFAGMVLKSDDEGDATMENVKIHDLYIHDTGSEGFYIGSTQSQPQHKIMGLQLYNNRVLRAGTELVQIGQIGGGSVIHHNVFMLGGLDWKDPFQPWQDNASQLGPREGNVTVHHNVYIGGAELMVNMHPVEWAGDVHSDGDLVHYHDNYFSNGRNAVGAYIGRFANGMTTYRFEDNIFREMVFSYDEISPGKAPPSYFFGVFHDQTNAIEILGNTWDSQSPLIKPAANVVNQGNINATTEPIEFVDSGFPADFDYFLVEMWAETSSANANAEVVYHEGDYVLWKGELYRCIAPGDHTGRLPPDHPETWQLMAAPADDVRLSPSSPYQGFGLVDTF